MFMWSFGLPNMEPEEGLPIRLPCGSNYLQFRRLDPLVKGSKPEKFVAPGLSSLKSLLSCSVLVFPECRQWSRPP